MRSAALMRCSYSGPCALNQAKVSGSKGSVTRMGGRSFRKVARAKKDALGVGDASGMGKLTGAVMKEFAGQADGQLVKEVVASLFA